MSGKFKTCCLLHEEKTWTRRRVSQNLKKIKTSQRSAVYQKKNNLVAFPPFLKFSVTFQQNRLPNVQDIKLFNVRPPPKFCFINLFMSSLSPVALTLFTLKLQQKLSSVLYNLLLQNLKPHLWLL